jgi:hypothetical protein
MHPPVAPTPAVPAYDPEPTPAAPVAAQPVVTPVPAPVPAAPAPPAPPVAPAQPNDANDADAGTPEPEPAVTPVCVLADGNRVTCEYQSNWYGELRWHAGNSEYGCNVAAQGMPYETCPIGNSCRVAQAHGVNLVGVCGHASAPVGGM